jgi:hypothetical protein
VTDQQQKVDAVGLQHDHRNSCLVSNNIYLKSEILQLPAAGPMAIFGCCGSSTNTDLRVKALLRRAEANSGLAQRVLAIQVRPGWFE